MYEYELAMGENGQVVDPSRIATRRATAPGQIA